MQTTVARYAIRLNTVSVVCENAIPDAAGFIGYRANDPKTAGQLVLDLLATVDPDVESFGFIALDGRHRMTGFKLLTQGTRTQAPVDSQKLFRCALALDATGIILFHNHPSNDLEASRDDADLTRRLALGGTFLGIPILDHIISTSQGNFISLRETRSDLFTV